MSLFWTFHGEADLAPVELAEMVARVADGAVSGERTVLREGMDATVLPGDDDGSTVEAFGFVERFSIIFNLHNLASPDVRAHNEALMVEAVLAVLEARPGRGVLAFYGSRVVMQRLDKSIEFADDWAEWLDSSELQSIVAEHSTATFEQPWE